MSPRSPARKASGVPEKVREVKQCKSCPWRVGSVPGRDIPGYDRALHEGLRETVEGGLGSLGQSIKRMACHVSRPGKDVVCAGWLENQLGVGNNFAVRLAVVAGDLPAPVVDGEQHESLEATLGESEDENEDDG